jgi:hypothetical protein
VAAFDTLKNRVVRLPEPVPVHILYWTTWVDDRGVGQFRRDVYAVDSLLTDALSHARRLPAPALEWARIRPPDSTSKALPQRAGAPPGPGAAGATPAAPGRR